MGKWIRTADEQQARLRKRQDKNEETARKHAAKAGVKMDGALYVAEHQGARNSFLVIFADRIEYTRPSRGLIFTTPKDVDVTPIRAVASVEVKKAALVESEVRIYTSGPVVAVKMLTDAALRFRDVLQEQLLAATAPADVPAPAGPNVLEQITQLGELKNAGVLTEAEFEAKKSEMLARL